MRLIKIGAVIALTAFAPGQLCASDSALGNITSYLIANSTSLFYFATDGSRTTVPSCATSTNWVVSIASGQGQAVMATVLTARLAGQKVLVSGYGSCPNDPGAETVNYVTVP